MTILQNVLGALLALCLALTVALLPCAWLAKLSGINVVVPLALTLVFGTLAVFLLSIVAILLRGWGLLRL